MSATSPHRKPWHRRLPWSDWSLNTVTYALVLLNLLPIIWMIYCGFRDNNEILSGAVAPGHRRYDVILASPYDDGLLAGTQVGGLALLDAQGKTVAERKLGTFATSYLRQGDTLWVLSSNRGLMRVSLPDLTVEAKYPVSQMAEAFGGSAAEGGQWKTLWVNDVAGSSLAAAAGRLYLCYQRRESSGVMAFDPKEEAFKPLGQYLVAEKGVPRTLRSRNDTLFILSSRGLSFYDPRSGTFPKFLTHPDVLPGEARNLVPLADGTLAMSLDAAAFLFDPVGDTVIAWVDQETGLGHSSISTLAAAGNRLFIGSGQGVYAVARDSTGLGLTLSVPQFPAERKAQKGDLAQVEVTALGLSPEGDLWMGGASGGLFRLSTSGISGISGAPGASGGSAAALSLRLPEPSPYFHWRNYIDLWRNIDFGLYLWNSLVVCFWVMVLAMIFASLGGYALARYNFPGRNFFGHAVLATQMVPGLLLLLPIYLMYVNFTEATGLMVKGTYWGLIVTYAAYFTPFSIWILRGFFASIPKELEEAALIDGCGPFHAFFRIILPSALPGIIATGVYVFLSAWDELMFAWVLTGEKTYTIPVGIRLFVGNFQNRYDLMMAAATVATIPVMALFFLMQRHIVAGLTAGAVKD